MNGWCECTENIIWPRGKGLEIESQTGKYCPVGTGERGYHVLVPETWSPF